MGEVLYVTLFNSSSFSSSQLYTDLWQVTGDMPVLQLSPQVSSLVSHNSGGTTLHMFLEVLVPLPGEMAMLSRPDSHKNRSTSSSSSSSSCLLYQLSSSNIFDSTGDQTTKPTGRSYNIEYLTLSSLLYQLSSSNIFDSKGDLTTEPTGRSYDIEYHCITLNSLINLVVSYDTSSLKRKQLVIDGDVESNPGPTPKGTPKGRKAKKTSFNFNMRKKLDMDSLKSDVICSAPIMDVIENQNLSSDVISSPILPESSIEPVASTSGKS